MEQDEDDKRKSIEWNFVPDNTTEEYLEYKKQKQHQEELLKTTPVQLKPYYKKKVNSYFNTLIKVNHFYLVIKACIAKSLEVISIYYILKQR